MLMDAIHGALFLALWLSAMYLRMQYSVFKTALQLRHQLKARAARFLH